MATNTNTLLMKVAEAGIGAVTGELYKDAKSAAFSPISKTIDYASHIETNYNKMKEEAKQLCAMIDHLQAQINWNLEKEATKVCQLWMERVQKIQEDVKALESEYFKDNGFFSRSDISKRMAEKYDEMHCCKLDVSNMEVLIEKPPSPVIKMIAPNIQDKPSLYEVFRMLTSYMADKKITRIGLWGMVGVGKTTIMKNLNNCENIAKGFDIVIFASLPDDVNEGKVNARNEWLDREPFELAKEKLQQQIAERLKLNVKGIKSTEMIAKRILERLKSKRYLLLLDNVWGIADLDEIGICDNQKDSKVVLASRHRDICKFMDVDENVKVERLSEAEAMVLFREKMGKNVNNSDFEKIATLVVRQCSNLPLLIDKVAGFFKKKNQELWWSGVRNFQKWPYLKFPGMEEVITLLRFCFEALDDEEKKLCFLYSALHTEGCDIYINYLVECCVAEGFVHDVDQGRIFIDDLVDVSLLEKGEKKKYVRMNRVLRNMALKISSEIKDLKFLVRAGEELQESPSDEEWKEAKQISLMDNRLCSLPTNPNCTNLSTLFLQRNATLMEIPELFFKSMQNLRVLDLHGTKVTALPFISCLTCLKALYLNYCDQLMELPSDIQALVHLEVLDIRGTGIYCLPVQIGCLRKLRCFRVSFSGFGGQSRMVKKHQKVLANLSSLEELVIEVEAHNEWWNNVVKDIIAEVATLRKLAALSFCFPDVECLGIFVVKSSLWKGPCFTFQLSVNQHYSTRYKTHNYFDYDSCRCLKYANGEGIDGTISQLLAETNSFELIGHKGDLRLSDYGIARVNKLRHCLIDECKEITTIIDANGAGESVLKSLEKIYIRNVPKLEIIWKGPVPAGSLSELRTFVLSKCTILKKIFTRGMIQQLCKLEELKVEECNEIEEIVMESENDGVEPSALPSLTTLVLDDLPKLRSIWKENTLECPCLKASKISKCPLLETLPFI